MCNDTLVSFVRPSDSSVLRKHEVLIRFVVFGLDGPGPGVDYEDVMQEARIAFLVALRKWDGTGNPWLSAKPAILRAARDTIARRRRVASVEESCGAVQ